jgi:hypothetical protein
MWKYERREKKLDKQKRRMPKHGKGISEVYKNATEKRANENK